MPPSDIIQEKMKPMKEIIAANGDLAILLANIMSKGQSILDKI